MGRDQLRQSMTAREIFELVHEDLELVEREIARESTASVATVTDIGRYLQSSGGKRLRPMLVLLAARLVGRADELALRLATVVEMIHTATLVHDDVIDVAETRRGKPSTNIIWGNHTCVLAGDWLYMQAFQVALRLRNFQFLDILIALTQLMVEGELIQLERLGRIDITQAEYEELIDRKTASLFSACARLGALAGGGDEATESRLAEFGWHLGMAFQLVDDVLDFTSREAVLGKPVGNDLREGKVTLPLIYALEAAAPEERRMVETVLRDNSYERVPFSRILDFVERRNGIERALARAQIFTEQARSIIGSFPASPAQRALAAVVELVIDRDH